MAAAAIACAAALAALPALAGGSLAAVPGALGVALIAAATLAARPEPVRWALLALVAAYGIPWGAPGVPWWTVTCAPLALVVGELAFWSLELAAVANEDADLRRRHARRLAAVAASALACGLLVAALSTPAAPSGTWLTLAGALAAGGLVAWLGARGRR